MFDGIHRRQHHIGQSLALGIGGGRRRPPGDAEVGKYVHLCNPLADSGPEVVVPDSRPAVQHKRNGYGCGERVDAVKVELGRKLIRAVRVSDCDGERVHARLSDKGAGLLRVGVVVFRYVENFGALGRAFIVADAAQLRLNLHADGMRFVRHFLYASEIFLKGEGGCVVHNRSEAELERAQARLLRLAMVKVHADGVRPPVLQ